MSNEKDKVRLKDIRRTFYDLRSFEISNLWQRSVFLSAILVVLLAGYGGLVIKMLECSDRWADWKWHLVCCVLSCLGVIFSAIWIMMAKGSKAWYEVYERRICSIEGRMVEAKLLKEEYTMYSDACPHKLDTNLLSGESGKFSVSKINILIGQVVGAIFALLFSVHIVLSVFNFWVVQQLDYCCTVFLFMVAFALGYILICWLIPYLKHKVESGSLKYPKEG